MHKLHFRKNTRDPTLRGRQSVRKLALQPRDNGHHGQTGGTAAVCPERVKAWGQPSGNIHPFCGSLKAWEDLDWKGGFRSNPEVSRAVRWLGLPEWRKDGKIKTFTSQTAGRTAVQNFQTVIIQTEQHSLPTPCHPSFPTDTYTDNTPGPLMPREHWSQKRSKWQECSPSVHTALAGSSAPHKSGKEA